MNFLSQLSERISNPSTAAEIKEAQTSFHTRLTAFEVKFLHRNHIYMCPYQKVPMVNTKQVIITSLKDTSVLTHIKGRLQAF